MCDARPWVSAKRIFHYTLRRLRARELAGPPQFCLLTKAPWSLSGSVARLRHSPQRRYNQEDPRLTQRLPHRLRRSRLDMEDLRNIAVFLQPSLLIVTAPLFSAVFPH